MFVIICNNFFEFSGDKKRHFQVNICDSVRGGACPKDSLLCEITDKSTLLDPSKFVDKNSVKMSTTFDKSTQNVILKYESADKTAIVEIVCDQSAAAPILQVKHYLKWNKKSCFYPFNSCLCFIHIR